MNRHRRRNRIQLATEWVMRYAWFQFMLGFLFASIFLWGAVVLTIVSHPANLFIP